MDKRYLTLFLFIASLMSAMQQPKKVRHFLVENQIITLFEEVAEQSITLKNLIEQTIDTKAYIRLPEPLITVPLMEEHIIPLMQACHYLTNLKDTALLDALEKMLHRAPLFSVIRACSYLDFQPGVAVAARKIAAKESTCREFFKDYSLKDVRSVVAKYCYLKHNKKLKGVKNADYGFSVGEYFIYRKPVLTKKELRLKSKQINSLEGLSFCFDLQIIELSFNHIAMIEPHDFDNLCNVTACDLSKNKICAISAAALSNLKNIKTLILDYNCLEKLEVFPRLTTLESLSILHNNFYAVPTNTFVNLEGLKYLNLDGCKIEKLYPDAFKGLTQLNELNLNNNRLSILEKEFFSDLYQLYELRLSNNTIQKLSNNSFAKLGQLTRLYLHYNNIQHIAVDAFKGLTNLRYIDLKSNPIKERSLLDCFKGLKNLENINLSQDRTSLRAVRPI